MNDLLEAKVKAALELASGATSGPWHWDSDEYDGGIKRSRVTALGRTITQGYYIDAQGEIDAKFIASAPDLVALIRDLHAALLASEEARGKAEADAGRYRWLRDKACSTRGRTPFIVIGYSDEDCVVISQERADKAIDAAIQGESK